MRERNRFPLTAETLRELGPKIVEAFRYDHSAERVNALLSACESKARELIEKNGSAGDLAAYAQDLRRRVSDVRTIMRTNKPEAAIAVMFDVGMLMQLLRLQSGDAADIALEHRTQAMSATEASRKLHYSTTKGDADAGRKRVEREIKAGVLTAVRVSPRARKWWFDKRQIQDG